MTTIKENSLFRAAGSIAFVIIIAKMLGFIRDICIANYYGAGLVSDAYFYAYQIPALAVILLGGVGGPFHSAVVSVFAKLVPAQTDEEKEKINRLFNTFLTVSFIVFAILAVLIFIYAKPIMHFIASGGSDELVSLSALHLRLMSPVVVIGGIIGIYYGILITFKHFLLPNLSPVIVSATIILLIVLDKNDTTGTTLALATTVGAVLLFLAQFPAVHKLGFRIKPNLDIKNNKNFKDLMELLFPAILSSTVGQIYVYVDMFFSSRLEDGAWSAIGYANRIFQFPVGILVTAFLVPLFPLFSKLAAENNHSEIKRYFDKGVGLLNFVAVPIMFGIILLASDVVQLIFQRGAFDSRATFMVSQALIFLSFCILPYVLRDSLTRIYYSFNDSKTPFLIAFSSIILKFILNWTLVDKLGIGAITLSTSLVTLINAFILAILVNKKIDISYKNYLLNLFKMFMAGVCAFSINWFIYSLWQIDMTNWILLAVKTFVMIISCLALYVMFTLIFRVNYVGEVIERIKNFKIKRN